MRWLTLALSARSGLAAVPLRPVPSHSRRLRTARASGFVADSCPTPNKNLPETMLAGVALFDYDNDGYLDVYFVNGAAIPSLKKESPEILESPVPQ